MDLQTLTTRQAKHTHNAKVILDLAEKNGRALTADEEKQHEAEVKALEEIGTQIAKRKSDDQFQETLAELTGTGAPGGPSTARFLVSPLRGQKSLGEQFATDPQVQEWFKTKGLRSQYWSSPTVELKTLLTEGGLVVPQYQPGITPGPPPVIVVAQLVAPGTTDSNAVLFMAETAYTNAAAPVAEGATKPESALTFTQTQAPVRKIAHVLPCSDEILEDVPTLVSYINARLQQGVAGALDNQLLNGDGVAPNLLGFLATPGLAAPIAQGTGTAIDAIGAQIAAIQTAMGLKPDGIVVHPKDWLFMTQEKSTTKNYLGTGPFDAPVVPTIWGLPVAQTPKIAQGTALVGAFAAASQLFVKGGIRTQATNSHQDYFVKNLTMIRSEIRVALAVYRPAAFGLVTGLVATP